MVDRRVVVTRDESGDGPLTRALVALGARVINVPCVRFPATGEADHARAILNGFEPEDWVVFTSARAVRALGEAPPSLSVRVATVGLATAREAKRAGWPVAIAGRAGARELAERMVRDEPLGDRRVLFPASAGAATELEDLLRQAGAVVDRRTVYSIEHPEPQPEVMMDLDLRGADAITFCSPSAVRGFRHIVGSERAARLRAEAVFVAIGPTTGAAVSEDFDVDPILAATPDMGAVAQATSLALGHVPVVREEG
jgi:uroporphyrinogen-III synthase